LSNNECPRRTEPKKEGEEDVQNEKLRRDAKPLWGVTAYQPRDESKGGAKKGSEERVERGGARSKIEGKSQLVSVYFFEISSRQNSAMMKENTVGSEKGQSASGNANKTDGR
jgi:hypothetical protein